MATSMKGSGYGGGCKNKLFSSSQQCQKSFFVFPSTRIVANLRALKHDHDSDGDIIRPLSADEVLKKGFSTEAIKALTLDDISEEDLFQVDFVVGPERASSVTEVLTKLGLKFNQTDVWGGFGLQYRELRVEEIELGTPLADPGLKYFAYNHFACYVKYSAILKAFESSESSVSVGVDTNNNSKRVAVLVIGGGGREHALCHALQRSPSCDTVFCAPGNAGITSSGNATCISDLDVYDGAAVESFCRKWGVGLVVVGPEAPLVAGLSNYLVKAGIPTFGPSAEAAALEGSKNFMKHLCDKYDIPTAKYKTFTDPSAARQYIQEEGAPIVIKADGLAAGKGVTVAMTLEEAYEAVDSMLVKGDFGSAGCRIIVEEFLEGEEVSFFALADGENAIPLESAQDHKRVGDGDTGPNTGGMGAYSPAPILTKELQSIVMDSIIMPTVKGMSAEGCKFVGVLYAGLMIEKESGMPKLIEYNVRFGDPECQVLMVRLESDLVQVLLAACRGELSGVSLDWSPESAMVVVMASKGYPGSYEKGTIIENLEEAELVAPDIKIFHAGTAFDSEGRFIATGGRVLGVTAKGNDLEEACDRAYQAVENVNWPGGFYRRDIGWRALPQKQHASKV